MVEHENWENQDIPKSPLFLKMNFYLYIMQFIYLICFILFSLFLLPSGKGYNGAKKEVSFLKRKQKFTNKFHLERRLGKNATLTEP